MEVIKPGYRRVTEVMNRYTDFSNIDPVVLARAADRGTRVHGFCSLHAAGTPVFFVDDDCAGYVKSFEEWFSNRVDKVLVNEDRFYCDKWRITGAIDLVVILKGESKPTIIDIKSPATTSKSWALQTAAYQYLYNKEVGKCAYGPADRRLVLMVRKDGSAAKVVEYNNPMHWEIYLGILKAERYFG